jgi:glutamine amidotransferase
VILDYGSGNLRSAQRALERAGAQVMISADEIEALNADGLVVPGVGAFAACMTGLNSVRGPRIVDQRLAGGRPVLGICVGMQVMFETGVEQGLRTPGLGQWPGVVERIDAPILPHMGWDTISPPSTSSLFRGLEDEMFYFVHTYGVRTWEWASDASSSQWARPEPAVSWCTYGEPFVAAVENGPLTATQFHPEKSADAGIEVLRRWVGTL